MIQFILILLITAVLLGGLLLLLRRKRTGGEAPDEGRFNLDDIRDFIRAALQDAISAPVYDSSLNEEEFNRKKARKNELRRALRSCMHGDLASKKYVKAYMKDILVAAYGFNETNIHRVIPFDRRDRLTPHQMFDILLHVYQKKYGPDALSRLIQAYELDRLRELPDGSKGYRITGEDVTAIYQAEAPPLSMQDKLDIVVQQVYQSYKGLGAVDEIRDQNIDGVNGGTSGVPSDIAQSLELDGYASQRQRPPRAYDGIWIFYKGKSVHLSFLSFGSDLELKRVCQNMYSFGSPGQLNESNGYMVNDMADGSRVVVVRPKMSESWAFFVRKFDISKAELEELLKDENAELAVDMIRFLLKGARVTGITGQQGTGKTTLLMAMVAHIYGTLNLRIQEMAFELRLRKIYPERNILSFRETPTVSGQEGLDTQKKTDGAVNILGEVASHPIASWMIQMAQVASLFTLFTHHAKTFPNLIYALRNSLLATGVFSNEKVAEKQVVDVIGFNIHLVKNEAGHRYIERITECIPLEDTVPYPKKYREAEELPDKLDAFMETMTEYFERSTDRKSFSYQDVVVWREGRYVAGPRMTERNVREMLLHMNEEDAVAFRRFLATHWGEAS